MIEVEGEVSGEECKEVELRRDLDLVCFVGEGVGDLPGDCVSTEGSAEEGEAEEVEAKGI